MDESYILCLVAKCHRIFLISSRLNEYSIIVTDYHIVKWGLVLKTILKVLMSISLNVCSQS